MELPFLIKNGSEVIGVVVPSEEDATPVVALADGYTVETCSQRKAWVAYDRFMPEEL
jgi:hypothetical protein